MLKIRFLPLAMSISLLACAPNSIAEPVKLSNSGICHDQGSNWYSRTKNFDAFGSMEQCVSNGGRPYSGYRPTGANINISEGYDRKLFPHWLDIDSDCQDTRAEVLIYQSLKKVSYSGNRTCYVSIGHWYDPYTNTTFTDDDDLDIDHIVPLKWAYDHGADKWDTEKRASLANDFENLLAVSSSANRSKGAKGPTQWLPSNQSYRCEYIAKFTGIVHKYGLTFTSSEQRTLNKMSNACSV